MIPRKFMKWASGVAALLLCTTLASAGGPAPVNDDCADALPIGDGLTPFDTTGAVQDGIEHGNSCGFLGTVDHDIWYEYTATCTGVLTVTTCEQLGGSADYDTSLVLYNAGVACTPSSDADVLACNGDDPSNPCGGGAGGFHSTLSAFVNAGSTYLLRVGGFDSASEGSGELLISCKSASAFECLTGVGCQLPDQMGHGAAGTVGATSDLNPGAGFRVSDDLHIAADGAITSVCWWGLYVDFSLPADCGPGTGDAFTITYYFDDAGGMVPGSVRAGPFPVLPIKAETFVLIPTGIGPIKEYGFEASHLPVPVLAGECLWIEITNSTTGNCFWLWETAPPGNGQAAQDDGAGYAPTDYDLAFCVDIATAPESCEREGACCTNGDCIELPQSVCEGMGGVFLGPFTSCDETTCNDACVLRTEIGVPDLVFGSTSGATGDPGTPFCNVSVTAPGVWYSVIGNGHFLTATTCNPATNYDTKLSVFCGCSCADLVCIAGNDDAGCGYGPLNSTVSWCSVEGQEYFILVHGFSTSSGDFALEIIDDGLPCVNNIDCETSKLTLETAPCPDDADAASGYQIAVEVWMRDLCIPATGFQAFLNYDASVLSYRGDLSSYTPDPFPLHIQPIATAEVASGEIRLDGADSLGDPGETADSLLAILVFDVDVECVSTEVTFDLTQEFDSELSLEGNPIFTTLINSGSFFTDDTPPVLGDCPDDIEVASDANLGCGAIVTFDAPTATDNCDGPVVVTCSHPSGSTFPVGTTTVTCSATDACGNTSSCTFDVTVQPVNLVDVDIELEGVFIDPVDRCIHFVLDDCAVTTDHTLTFVDHDSDSGTPVRFIGTITVPCGNWTQICAKDEQHTLWDSSPLVLSGGGLTYDATAAISLEPGDNDNDGDVDINDVTLLIAQFGDFALDGGCPWDGTRDADFSNNTVIGSEDYSLLSSNWLTATSCQCTALMAGPQQPPAVSIATSALAPEVGKRVDLNRDGVFDYKDVKLFEAQHGLPNALSTQMESISTGHR